MESEHSYKSKKLPMSKGKISQSRASPGLFFLVLTFTLAFIFLYLYYLSNTIRGIPIPPLIMTLLSAKIAIELFCAFYVIAFVLISLFYLFQKPSCNTEKPPSAVKYPSIAIFYLCCNDLDLDSVRSLCRINYPGKWTLFVHDDSTDPEMNQQVDNSISKIHSENEHLDIRILRRQNKAGGKPGALNYLLKQIDGLYECFLLCDNDSIALDPDCLTKTIDHLADPDIAIVQFRNRGVLPDNDNQINRIIYRAVDVFHVFISVLRKYGWQSFFGHNAVLKTRPVIESGGFTPGAFADDFDLTLRLNFKGFRVIYIPEIEFGEKHPPSYKAFRKRSYKWAYGCAQVLDKYAWKVLKTNKLSLAEKWGFFQLSFFYVFQTVLLFYLFLTFLVLPYLLGRHEYNVYTSFISGLLIALFIFLPMIVYGIKDKNVKNIFRLTGLCGIVYGSTDFVSVRGVFDHLQRKKVSWIPTNYNPSGKGIIPLFAGVEFLFGVALIIVPLMRAPQFLTMPTTYLFALKFLSIPFLYYYYREGD